MPTIKPFDGYLVDPEQASSVVTPAYDAMLPQERRAFAEANPDNYVNVMRSLEEFAGEDDAPTLDEILRHNRERLDALHARDAFIRTPKPGYFLYKLAVDGHEQVGVIAEIRVEEYEQGRLRKHENTQTEKENLLTDYLRTVGVSSSPICVAYQPNETISSAIAEAMKREPCLQVSAWDDVTQTVWHVDDPELASMLESGFDSIEETYLTDGHHRCASGVRHAAAVRETGAADDSQSMSNYLLVALFSADDLRVFSYFRCVQDLNGLSPDEFLASLEHAGFEIHRKDALDAGNLLPSQSKEVTVFIDAEPYGIHIPNALVPHDDPVRSLDVSILQERILAPILGIGDARSDVRLSYMPGVAGVDGLIARYRDDGWRLGFACFNTTIQEIMDVADAGQVMPPKSTWFDPKLRAGLFLRHC